MSLRPVLRPVARGLLALSNDEGIVRTGRSMRHRPGALRIPNRSLRTDRQVSPSWLFRASEVGAWLEPYNPAELYPRRNRFLYSQEFDNAVWLKQASGTGSVPVVTANAGLAPDGTMTADRIVFDKGAGTTSSDTSSLTFNGGVLGGMRTAITGKPVAGSIYLKTEDGSTKTMRYDFNGAVNTGDGAVLITVTGEWQRFTYVLNSPTDASRFPVLRLRADIPGGGGVSTDNQVTVLAWGAQFELGSVVTDYQKVTDWQTEYAAGVNLADVRLWQDSAGTVPVSMYEQPVGLMLDRRQGTGAALTQSSAAGLAGGSLVDNGDGTYTLSTTAVGNLARFDYSDAADDGYHRPKIEVVSVTGAVSWTMDWGDSATAVGFTAAGTYQVISRPLVAGNKWVDITNGGGGAGTITFRISARSCPGNHALQATAASRPVLSARVNILQNSELLATSTATTIAASYRLRFSGTGTVTLSGTASGAYAADTDHTVVCTAGTLTYTVAGTVTFADMRLVADTLLNIPQYQRTGNTIAAVDYDTIGFPPFLRFDGTDDWLSAAMDWSGANKLTAWAGIQKRTDAAGTVAYELTASSTTTAASFGLRAPATNGLAEYNATSGGTTPGIAKSVTGYAAPITNVVTATSDIAAPSVNVRVNGVAAAATTTSQGTGNYANSTLYVGRRGGTTLPLNGRIYCLVLRGATTDATLLSQIERYVAQRSGVTL